MKARLIASLVIALMLVAVVAAPAMAADYEEGSVGASVTVNEFVNITIVDEGATGINFGSVNPGATYGDTDQSDGTPAVEVRVESDTNVIVDIGIKGTDATLALANWKYSLTYAGSQIPLTGSYVEEYSDQGAGDYPFYHWLAVPSGTTAGSYTCNVWYKAVGPGQTL